jgi:hypothetical protein
MGCIRHVRDSQDGLPRRSEALDRTAVRRSERVPSRVEADEGVLGSAAERKDVAGRFEEKFLGALFLRFVLRQWRDGKAVGSLVKNEFKVTHTASVYPTRCRRLFEFAETDCRATGGALPQHTDEDDFSAERKR